MTDPYFAVGSQNWSYADVHGNIAYFTSAEMPVREDLQAGTVNGLPPWFIRNGQGGNEWLPVEHPQPHQAIPYDICPAAEMPHIINPPAGRDHLRGVALLRGHPHHRRPPQRAARADR